MSKNPKMPLERALAVVRKLETAIDPKLFTVCGSVRRMKYAVGDLDIAISSENFADFSKLMEKFVAKESLFYTKDGRLKSAIIDGVKVELYVGPRSGFGAMIMYEPKKK